MHRVTQLRSHRNPVAQVVVALGQFTPPRAVGLPLNHRQPQRLLAYSPA